MPELLLLLRIYSSGNCTQCTHTHSHSRSVAVDCNGNGKHALKLS